MNQKLEQLMSISNYLKLRVYSEKILKMQHALENKEYFLTVMGQFSAGKSCLINNIIGKEILPVHITETTAIITVIRYGKDEYANLRYKDGTMEDISIEESLGLWQSGENGNRLSDIEQINIYVNSELLKNGLIIADTPGVNTIISEHIELTADIIEAADRVFYVMGKSVTDIDLDFVGSILESGVKIIFVRTHMDELKGSEECDLDTVEKEKSILSEYTENDIFFVSNDKSNKYYGEIDKLKNYLSQKLASNVEQALNESIMESIQFIACRLMAELIDRKKFLDCALSDDRKVYLKHKAEIESSLEKMKDILQRNREKFTEKYQKTKQYARENLDESEALIIKNVQHKIVELDYGTAYEKYAESVKNILKSGCLNLQKTYLSYFDTMLKDNKELLDSQLSDIGFAIQIDSEMPENLSEAGKKTQEITEKLNALNMLKKQLNDELGEIQNVRDLAVEEREAVLAEQQILKDALESVQEELREYPEYVAQYCEAQSATHDSENAMRTVGQILDAATILIPGAAWANIGSKLLNVSAKGAKFIKAAKTAEKLTQTAKTINEGQKAIKAIDAGVDIMRIYKGKRISKKKREMLEEEIRTKAEMARKMNAKIDDIEEKIRLEREKKDEKTSLLDYLSIEYYFAKIGKKFDKPQILQIDCEYEKKYNDEKREIEQRLREQAEAEYKKRQELLDITNRQEQLELKQMIISKKQKSAEEEEQALKKQLENSKYNDKVKAIREHYSNLAVDKISEFCNILRNEKSDEIDKKIIGYINNFDFSICSNINRKYMELDELNKRYESTERENLKKEAAACAKYQKFLETIIG